MDNEEVMLLRNSERKAYRRCRQKWQWSYVDFLEAKTQKGALVFGTLIHAALEHWYIPGKKRGVHPAETFAELYDSEVEEEFIVWDEDSERLGPRELGIAMMEAYVEQWGTDPHLEVISPEHPFQLDVHLKGGEYLATLVGRYDLVFRDLSNGRVWLSDHKTAKSIKTDHLQLDDQAGGYLLAAEPVLRSQGVLGDDERISGILYNYMRKAMPDPRPKDEHGRALNKDGSVSKRQPSPLFLRMPVHRSPADNRMQLRRLRMEAYEVGMAREGVLPVYKNPTMDCSWDCQFFDMCIMHETGADWEDYRDEAYEQWDPYDTEHQDAVYGAQ
jgi:hypothetical protein